MNICALVYKNVSRNSYLMHNISVHETSNICCYHHAHVSE